MPDKLREAGSVVGSLRAALAEGEAGLKSIPGLLLRIVNDHLWEERLDLPSGQTVQFENFIDFVTTAPIEGLGEDPEMLLDLCKRNADAYRVVRRAMKRRHGGDRKSANHKIKSAIGTLDKKGSNTRVYGLTWLNEHRPDLYAAVVRKELSVNRAMEIAGKREHKLHIPDNPEGAARALLRAWDRARITALIAALVAQTAAGAEDHPP